MIIGIAGTIGAGKGTVVDYLKAKGFAHYSSSGLLKELLKEQGLPAIRDYMSPLATQMRAEDPGGVPKRIYERYLKEQPQNAIFEALHSVGEAEFIRSIGGKIIGVDADVRVRYERSQKRGEEKDQLSYDDFLRQVRIEDEGSAEDAARNNNIRAVLETADVVIQNNGSLEELQEQIETALVQIA
ncbi:MAG TPA: AAA family ATPase [Candidatus Paceibacterota bacterium]|nr:AAA family ATPase [Candidatus Paceibacterota bacterium]